MMRYTTVALIVILLTAFVAVDITAADPQGGRDRREARRSGEAEESQPETPAPAETGSPAETLGLVVYPSSGQSAEQQAADEAECSKWAQEQTAKAPAAEPEPVEAADATGRDKRQDRRTGGAVKGAAKGAVIGEALDDEPEVGDNLGKARDDFEAPDSRDDVGDNLENAIDDDDPSGAEVGAAVGAVAGRRKQTKAQNQAEAQAAQATATAAASAENEGLKKAMSVCLEGKGYKVG